ncbi:MAG: polysaccharide deacetylase family protein [Saprospiraceae bacterium]|nr:polysaccharide deacetylase family protein [Saprospiraceae bacterium]
MSIRNYKKIVSLSAPAITALGLHHVFDKKYSGRGHILMFHRVLPKDNRPRVHNHESLEIDPEQLEQTILFFKKRNYLFLSINELSDHLKSDTKRKFVVFTFDDGYIDNLIYAYPIFKKYGIPFTIYITSNFINARTVIWWYQLEEELLKKDQLIFTWQNQEHHLAAETKTQKEIAFEEVRKLITGTANPHQYLDQLSKFFGMAEEQLFAYTRSHAMNWDQLTELAKDPIVTIGAHTANHLPLKNLESDQLYAEIINSKIEIEDHIKKKIYHFAYPFGKKLEAGEREYEFVKSHHFRTAVTTNIGNIFTGHLNHLHKLPRVNINSLTTEDVLELQVSGMVSFFINGKDQVLQ